MYKLLNFESHNILSKSVYVKHGGNFSPLPFAEGSIDQSLGAASFLKACRNKQSFKVEGCNNCSQVMMLLYLFCCVCIEVEIAAILHFTALRIYIHYIHDGPICLTCINSGNFFVLTAGNRPNTTEF